MRLPIILGAPFMLFVLGLGLEIVAGLSKQHNGAPFPHFEDDELEYSSGLQRIPGTSKQHPRYFWRNFVTVSGGE